MAREKVARKGILRRIFTVLLGAVVIFAAFSASVSAYILASTRNDVHTIAQIEESGAHAQAILVLGASVLPSGKPSDILADRLEVAADLFLAGAADQIIVSGDNREAHYNESDAMKAYCVSLGVPADDVVVDHAGYDTYASVYRAKHVYGADDVMIVTQAYHLYRALAIAQGLGMIAQGVAADKGAYDNQMSYSLREVIARDKDFLQTLFRIPPEDASQPMTS